MPHVHLIEGPVGAGKSTYGLELAERLAVSPLVLDEWMAVLFRPDRPDDGFMDWYLERKRRCIEQIWNLAQALIGRGHDAILELGLVQRQDRLDFYSRLDTAGLAYTVHILDAPREVRAARVAARNQKRGATFQMEVTPEIFALADRFWEPVESQEASGRDVRFVATGSDAGQP